MKIYSIWYEANVQYPQTTLIQGDRPVCVNGEQQPNCDIMIFLFEAYSWEDAVKVYDEFIEEWFYLLLEDKSNYFYFEGDFIEGFGLLRDRKCLFPLSDYNTFIDDGDNG